ncbi:MAG: HEPN domain-containing protein [Deltaproteobacteria bacterium]|nr:HEPN domain-containing protein [Deltaproteobacteria bacterium]
MPRKESLYPMDWIRIAEKDLARVTHLLKEDDPEAAGFFLQQSLEKFLKAFLLSKGWKLERIHDLESLINATLEFDPSFEEFREACQKITAFYFFERYPFMAEETLSEDDVRIALDQVRKLVEKIRKIQ